MGQQQLLLVILVTIIVGIATVVAINTFGSAADQANRDAVNNDLASIASSAQGYYMRPAMLGGGSRSFVGLNFEGMAVPGEIFNLPAATIMTNENGTYEITTAGTADEIVVTGTPASVDNYTAGTSVTTVAAGALIATITPNNLSISQ